MSIGRVCVLKNDKYRFYTGKGDTPTFTIHINIKLNLKQLKKALFITAMLCSFCFVSCEDSDSMRDNRDNRTTHLRQPENF